MALQPRSSSSRGQGPQWGSCCPGRPLRPGSPASATAPASPARCSAAPGALPSPAPAPHQEAKAASVSSSSPHTEPAARGTFSCSSACPAGHTDAAPAQEEAHSAAPQAAQSGCPWAPPGLHSSLFPGTKSPQAASLEPSGAATRDLSSSELCVSQTAGDAWEESQGDPARCRFTAKAKMDQGQLPWSNLGLLDIFVILKWEVKTLGDSLEQCQVDHRRSSFHQKRKITSGTCLGAVWGCHLKYQVPKPERKRLWQVARGVFSAFWQRNTST